MNIENPSAGETPLKVRRGRVDSVDLYEVKENELELLEKGSPATLQLNFAIFLISMAFTSIVALVTTNFKWPLVETIFIFLSLIGIFMGGYLLISWWRTRTSITKMIKTIRGRICDESAASYKDAPKEGVNENDSQAPVG